MIWKTLILYANTLITSLLIVITIQLGTTAFLFFTETTRRLEVFGRLFVEVISDGGMTVELGFDSSLILSIILSFLIASIITIKKNHHGTSTPA